MTCFILFGFPSIILSSLSFFTEITSETNFTEVDLDNLGDSNSDKE